MSKYGVMKGNIIEKIVYMELKINPYSFGERPQVTPPTHQFYKVLGEEGIYLLEYTLFYLRKTNKYQIS